MIMKIKDRIEQLEMAVYCLGRPLYIENKESVVLNGEAELFKVKAGGAVRWGIIYIKPIDAAPCGLEIRIYDSAGVLQISSSGLRMAEGSALSIPFYYKGSSELSVRAYGDGVSIGAGEVFAVVSGGRE
jgi:hypothetical protein